MKIALFDIDGVLADDRHRVQSALDGDWATYFHPLNVAKDLAYDQGRDAVESAQDKGYTIVYLTGRRSALRTVTEWWLDSTEFPLGRLIMREPDWYADLGQTLMAAPTWRSQPLAFFKLEIMQELQHRMPELEDIVLYDDDPEVVRVVRDGIGSQHAVHCTWHIKPSALVKRATA